jgi:hypothetical protein
LRVAPIPPFPDGGIDGFWRAVMRPLYFSPAIFFVILSTGCGGQAEKTKVPYTLARQNGNPVLTMGKLTVIFEGIPMKGADASLSEGFFFVPHAGTKAEGGTSEVNELKIKENIESDNNNVIFNNYSFRIIEKGAKIRIGDKTLTIDEGPQTIVVSKAGIVQAR